MGERISTGLRSRRADAGAARRRASLPRSRRRGRGPSRLMTSVAAVALLLALACAGDSGPPHWIEHPHRKFPEERYTTGVGQGANREAAAEAARAEIARQTEGETEGVEISRHWTAKQPRVHWALATLDRPALVERLAKRIGEGEEQLAAAAESAAEKDLPPSQALERLLAAFELIHERDVLRRRIQVLDGTPPPPETTPSRGELEGRLAAVKRLLPIAVEAQETDTSTGSPIAPLDVARRALAQQVLAKGFALAPESEWGDTPAWLRVHARVAFEELDLGHRDDFTSIQWDASLEIEDPASEARTLALLSDRARAVHLNSHSTLRLAQEQAVEFLAQAFASWLDARYAPQPAPQPTPPSAPQAVPEAAPRSDGPAAPQP